VDTGAGEDAAATSLVFAKFVHLKARHPVGIARASQRDNARVVGDLLVDTGINQSSGKIARVLEGRSIAAIALIRARGDHAGAMKRLAEQLGVPVWCDAADREATETGRRVLSARVSGCALAG
jgi:glyoxylase-like metal-dependent hydrolase (beta-lactamase superfamily II)